MGRKRKNQQSMLTIIFLSTVLSLSMSEAFNSSLNDAGWNRSGDYFYLISQEKMNWFEARQFCHDHHGFLAEIKSCHLIIIIGLAWKTSLKKVDLFGITVRKKWNFLIGMKDNPTIGMMKERIAYPCILLELGMI